MKQAWQVYIGYLNFSTADCEGRKHGKLVSVYIGYLNFSTADCEGKLLSYRQAKSYAPRLMEERVMHELMLLHVLEIQLNNACIAALADKPSTVANPTCMVGLCTMKPAVCCLIRLTPLSSSISLYAHKGHLITPLYFHKRVIVVYILSVFYNLSTRYRTFV